MATTLNPASLGTSLGQRLALMRERVLPPGAVLRMKLIWQRCKGIDGFSDRDCELKGPVLICGRCWDEEKVFAGLTILGPLDAPLGTECEQCGGRDSEVQYADSPEIRRQVEEIAKWNAALNQGRRTR